MLLNCGGFMAVGKTRPKPLRGASCQILVQTHTLSGRYGASVHKSGTELKLS